MSNSARKRKPLSQLTIEEATASRKKSKATENENHLQRRAGTINYMILKNFMCHSLLEVKFDSNISIVIGKNGSGKSAILTAIIVGLGGKATLTNRGSSVKGFVKAGKTTGSIEIQLHNEGPMAYRPSVYGKTITITRNLSAAGGGSYRIKSDAGEIISTQAREVSNITTNLNIQIDNPVCVLNQDTSRNFLSSNDPKNKFILFMRATKLDTLEAEYKKIQNNRRDSLACLEEKELHFGNLQEEIKRLKRKIEGHKSVVALRDKKKLLQLELLWAKVRDAEKDLEEKCVEVDRMEQKIEELKEKMNESVTKKESLQENIRELERQVSEIKDQILIQNKPLLDLREVLTDLRNKYSRKKQEKQTLSAVIESKKMDIHELEQEISNVNENMTKIEQQKMQRMKDIAALQDKLKGLDDVLDTTKNDLFQIKTDISRKQEDVQNLTHEINQINHKLVQDTNNMKALQEESNNELFLYGNHMPKIKQMIEQYKQQFEHEPRGPLGAYLKLKDKKWAVAVEGYIGPHNLNSFVVNSTRDSKLLRQIFNKTCTDGQKPSVIISKFVYKKHDVRPNLVQAPQDCISLYDAIGIEDTIVSNCIIDQCSIEGILLIPSNARAMELLSYRNSVPKNCLRGLTINGDNYYPDPNYKTYGSRYHRAKYLQVDTSEYITSLKQNIENLTKQRTSIQHQLRTLQQEVTQQQAKRNELEDKVKKIMLIKSKTKQQYEDLSSEAEPEVQNVHYLEMELEEIKKVITEKSGQIENIVEETKEVKLKIIETEEKIRKLENSSASMQNRMQPLQEQIKENQIKLREISSSKEFAQRRVQDHEKKLVTGRSEIVMKQNNVKKYATEASTVGQRLPELREVPEISQDLNEVDATISRIETGTDNVSDVLDKYNELYEKYKTAVDILKNINQDVQELNKAVERRNKHYKLTESYFITFIKHSFKKILEFRQFKGNININMDEKKLELIVIPQHGTQGQLTTSNLSGGERSFSTVAFLYALWQCMEFPFYFLDEFDVYMDRLNRTKVIDILLHHANSRPELQFVFLTPQDVSFINKDVSILRLQDPERFRV